MRLVYSGRYQIDIGTHVFPTAKYPQVFERLAAAGLADLVRHTTLRRVYETNYGGREECLALMQRAGRALADLEHMKDDIADITARAQRLRSTAAYRADGDTVPLQDTLEAAGAVLLEEFWDIYKVLLR
jgi:hypothetical protein